MVVVKLWSWGSLCGTRVSSSDDVFPSSRQMMVALGGELVGASGVLPLVSQVGFG
jgi:hypothetical protein